MDRERLHDEAVSVEISGCDKDDARIVFEALSTCFESDRAPDEVPQQLHESRPMVWLGTFEVTDTQDCPPPARLSSRVEADAQGGYWAIERLRTTLDSLFTVHDQTSASGDQERELHVVLESRPEAS
ncbi:MULTISPECIES: hypothetical protein [unclassified Streptomyces]|uniref:hypothetical protein n=1 Tax=unclassified Streptomyces TaxID=2593676 RepID=UPI00124FA4F4|nr:MULTISPECIES: hypothetical protein [unclassified Streptomyces]KAB2971262.1 hypothetical protein F8R89_03905 [Streptomyces sp. SS1-1]MDI9833134.1 hypothetical protein [Streptomyces sp. KAU_LT]